MGFCALVLCMWVVSVRFRELSICVLLRIVDTFIEIGTLARRVGFLYERLLSVGFGFFCSGCFTDIGLSYSRLVIPFVLVCLGIVERIAVRYVMNGYFSCWFLYSCRKT